MIDKEKLRSPNENLGPPDTLGILGMQKSRIEDIRKALNEPLPGWEAQSILSPVQTKKYRTPEPKAMHAGVNLLLFPGKKNELEVFFIKRPDRNPHDKHGGQVSFPGGKMEIQDPDLRFTAFRETEEEIGVPHNEMNYLGQLSPLYVYVSNFLVQPVVSYIDYKPELKLQESEVSYVITESLEYLSSPKALFKQDYTVRNFIMRDMPHYKLQNDILWGATAMITAEFMQVLRSL